MIWPTVESIAAVCMMALAGWAAGLPVVRRLPGLVEDLAARLLWALALGSMFWAWGLAGLGLAGFLYVPWIGGLSWLACLSGFYQLLRELESSTSYKFIPKLPFFWLPKTTPGARPPAEAPSSPWPPAAHWAEEALAKMGQGHHHCGPSLCAAAENPLPYEHAPPPDLVPPGGMPFWMPEPPAPPPPAGAPPDLLLEPADSEPLAEDPEAPDGPTMPSLAHQPPASGLWQRLDGPGQTEKPKQAAPGSSRPSGWLSSLVWSLGAGAALATLVVALAPPFDSEALGYHLELPKRWLQNHRLLPPPMQEASAPHLVQMWFLWALALDGEVAAQLVHWGWGVMFGWAAWYLARIFLQPCWAGMAGVVVLLTPAVLHQMTVPAGHLAMATFSTLAMAAFWQASFPIGPAESAKKPTRRAVWFGLAGLAFGAAGAGGPIGGLLGPVLFALWAVGYTHQQEHRRCLLQGAGWAVGLAFILLGSWYMLAGWYQSGWESTAGQRAVNKQMFSSLPNPTEKDPRTKNLNVLAPCNWPGRATQQWKLFGLKEDALGALWVAVLPGLLWTHRSRPIQGLLAAAGGYFLLWAFWQPHPALLLPILPMLASGVVWVWSQMDRLNRGPQWMAGLAMGITVLLPLGGLGRRFQDHLPVAVGLERRQEFLYRQVPSYPAAALANLLLGPDAKILTEDPNAFYFDPVVVQERIYRRLSRYDQQVRAPGDLARLLRQDGFTHVLLVEIISYSESPRKLSPQTNPEELSAQRVPSESTLARLVEAAMHQPNCNLQPVSEYRVTDAEGILRRYRLIAIH